MIAARIIFWWALAHVSYRFYCAGLPSGYGYISGKHMRAVLARSPQEGAAPHD